MEIKLNEINSLVYLTRTASYLCWNLNNKKKKTAILIIARIIIFLKYLVGLVGSINKSWEYLWPWNYRVYVALGTPMYPWTWNTGCSAVVGSCLLSRISSFLINTISRDDVPKECCWMWHLVTANLSNNVIILYVIIL